MLMLDALHWRELEHVHHTLINIKEGLTNMQTCVPHDKTYHNMVG